MTETHKQRLARLRAKRDAIRAGVKSHRPVTTPFARSWSRNAKPRGKG